MGYVYGIENKDGFFWNFALNRYTAWCPQCSIPSKQLAEDLHMMLIDEVHDDARVSPVSA